jgi:glycosyltransferase involved in cell wall biosynthesis
VLKLLGESDALLLTSEFEGLPVVVLEAMSQGCVPVVSAVNSGVSQLLDDGRNGFLVPVGDVNGFVTRLQQLASNRELVRTLGTAAFQTMQGGPYSSSQSAARYFEIFENCREDVRLGRFSRPRGRQQIPDYYRLTTRVGRRLRKLLMPERPPSPDALASLKGSAQ